MERRAAIACLVALTIALAGCQFGGPGTDVEGPSDGDADTPTPTTTTRPGPFGGISPPPGSDESGVTDVDALMTAHETALEGGSSTVDVEFDLSVNGSSQNVSFRGKTDPGSENGWMRVDFQDGTGTYYTEDETTYYREIVNERAQYGTAGDVSAIPERPRFGADERIRTALESADWEPVGTVEREGRTLLEYRAIRVDPPDVNTSVDATVTAGGQLLVDADGVVHHVSINTTVGNERGTVQYALSVTLTDVGSTTIERPGWFDNAS